MSLTEINTRIAKAARKAQRDKDDVTLIAVSKVQPNARVEAILQKGHRTFGENKVQEAAGKWPMFRETYNDVDLHLPKRFTRWTAQSSPRRLPALPKSAAHAPICSFKSTQGKKSRSQAFCHMMPTPSFKTHARWICQLLD